LNYDANCLSATLPQPHDEKIRATGSLGSFRFRWHNYVVTSLLFSKTPTAAAIQPLPNPNSYDEFVKAGEMVRPTYAAGDENWDKMNGENCASWVAKNSATALQLGGTSLQGGLPVPLTVFPGDWVSPTPSELARLQKKCPGVCG